MKRLTVVFVFALFIAAVVSSCKTPERCPAYGAAEAHLEATSNS